MSDDVTTRAESEMEWFRERERIREQESIEKHKTYERERPKFYFATLLGWLGVLAIGGGSVATAYPNYGHMLVYAGLWLVVQAIATFVVWAMRTADDPPRY